MIDRLIDALVRSKNEAADVVLLEALRVGNESEQRRALDALLRRKTVRGLVGVVSLFDRLSESLQAHILGNIKSFHSALREAGRGQKSALRLSAMKLIARGRQGKLIYVLSENLHSGEVALSRAAADSMVTLARWVSSETRRLQSGLEGDDAQRTYQELIEQRAEIESGVDRALNVHRGRHGQELLRAALLLCDSPQSRALGVLTTAKHAGHALIARRLQQPPEAEHVEAFLLSASHAHLRAHFATVFSHIDDRPVLDALLRRTHWLKDPAVRICMHQVKSGAWWQEESLTRDIASRTPQERIAIGNWIASSGAGDTTQDHMLLRILDAGPDDFSVRLGLIRAITRRPKGSSTTLLSALLKDPDERIVRMAVREIVRCRPTDCEGLLLPHLTDAAPSVRQLISRAVGKNGFEQYWERFDHLNKPTRARAGKAMLKIFPDAIARMQRRLAWGPVSERLKALQIAQELDLAPRLREPISRMCADPDPKLRSKAITLVGSLPEQAHVLVDRVLHDADARVRANAVEVLEAAQNAKFIPVLARVATAPTSANREKANAIKALARLRIGQTATHLVGMLKDSRPEHRISALWALRQVGWWQMLNHVGQMARADGNLRVRRYALGVLQDVAEIARSKKAQTMTAGAS